MSEQVKKATKTGENLIHLQPSNHAGLSLILPIKWGADEGVGERIEAANSERYHLQVLDVDRNLGLSVSGKWAKLDLVVRHIDGFESADTTELVGYLTEGYYLWTGAKRRKSVNQYRAAVEVVLANLLQAHRSGGELLLSRANTATKRTHKNPENITDMMLKHVADWFHAAGLLDMDKAPAGEHLKASSRCRPTPLLISLLERCRAEIGLHPGTDFAVIRERAQKGFDDVTNLIQRKRGELIRLPPSSREIPRLRKLGEPARLHAEVWRGHYAEVNGRILLPWVTRSFTESTKLGGRFYGTYQNLPSGERASITIDGEATVELDYKSLHPCLLYARENLPLVGDPYRVDGYERGLIKLMTLQLVNSDTLRTLKARITRSGQPDTQELHRRYVEQYQHYVEHGGRKPKMPRKLIGFIPGVPTGTDGSALVDALLERHQVIAHHFGQQDIGLHLQRQDSELMAQILTTLAKEGFRVLPVHDSVVCRVSDQVRVREVMEQAAVQVTGQRIAVEAK